MGLNARYEILGFLLHYLHLEGGPFLNCLLTRKAVLLNIGNRSPGNSHTIEMQGYVRWSWVSRQRMLGPALKNLILNRMPHQRIGRRRGKWFVLLILQTDVIIVEDVARHPPQIQRQFLKLSHVFVLFELVWNASSIQNCVHKMFAVRVVRVQLLDEVAAPVGQLLQQVP